MIVPYWLESEEAENEYKEILSDNIQHFYPGHPGTSCIFIDTVKETVAGIVHINNYQRQYKTADVSAVIFDKHAFTRSNIICIYQWIFEDLGVTRLNMATTKDNRQANRINKMMGAKLDAVLPMWWGDEPMYLYGLLAPDALKYLERLRNGTKKDDLGE